MEHPTRAAKQEPCTSSDEEKAWPLEARICALARMGIPPHDAWLMTPIESVHMLMIAQAQSIPPDERTSWASSEEAIKAAKLNF